MIDSKKLWDMTWVIDELKAKPHTYETLAECEYKNDTCFLLMRKKLNRLFLERKIQKSTIPGTRWGKMIFFCIPKNYYILVNSTRVGVDVFYFEKFEKISTHHIHIELAYKLNGCRWEETKNEVFYQGKILAFY